MFGDAIMELDKKKGQLSVMNAAKLRSRLDGYGNWVQHYIRHDKGLLLKPKRCSHDIAAVLMHTSEISETLPEIRVVTDAPVITEGGILKKGYHDNGVLVRGGSVKYVPLADAVVALLNLFRDFDFQSPSDKSRAVAMLITPALKVGELLTDPTPADVAEADQSQSGKTFRQEVVRMIYGEKAHLITKKTGGVGSLDESIGAGLMSGKQFLSFDNMRGLLDSQFLEAIITWMEAVSVRVPHKGEFNVDARSVTVQMSSNGVETTRDMANRSCIVRIRKQKPDYQWHQWPEGSLKQHVITKQSFYLGCVFAVVEAWIHKGMPRTNTTDHDFRVWGQTLDWMVQEIFGQAPLLDGHINIQRRVSEPHMNWLRSVCMAAHKTLQLETPLQAGYIADICEDEAIDWPNSRTPRDSGAATLYVGRILGKLFSDADTDHIEIDDYKVTRSQTEDYDPGQQKFRLIKHYVVAVTT